MGNSSTVYKKKDKSNASISIAIKVIILLELYGGIKSQLVSCLVVKAPLAHLVAPKVFSQPTTFSGQSQTFCDGLKTSFTGHGM